MSPAAKRCFRSEASQEAIRRACRELYAEAPGQLESLLLDTTPGPTHVLVGGSRERPAVLLLPGTGSNAASWFGEVFLGRFGLRQIQRQVLADVSLPAEALTFTRLVAEHCRPVTEAVPTFDDETLGRLNTTPLLYLGGEDDRLLNTQASARRLERVLPHARVKVLSGVGHVLMDQGPTLATFLDTSLS